ncbi:ribbon-helix-helix protein, CopG family [Paracoccus sp. TK19116]|uniref:Ribbon-helix-helix protein, CopG family n=2 Tax=Paracoccus albicereus TaxID=2922394 RepID=A0ABT1MMM0_9RHOB|nr:ribbon-helix-helix protein, CopG family [Paracoccus albicereus]MCQ0969535.1 ribbon-helix-helix protein, CopG family [Paracoccus albicereus]
MVKRLTRRIGRPPVDTEAVTVRLPRSTLEWLDRERAKHEPVPSRPEMIRRLIDERRT